MNDNLKDDFIKNFGINMSPYKVNSIIYPKPEFTSKLSRKRKAKGKKKRQKKTRQKKQYKKK
jgi:hypothetical protein|tara:strand:- start:3598 stop:3783 length:186 start_codon:yes stop_codon:yes gene_type:complete